MGLSPNSGSWNLDDAHPRACANDTFLGEKKSKWEEEIRKRNQSKKTNLIAPVLTRAWMFFG